jgi:hypothetical protein
MAENVTNQRILDDNKLLALAPPQKKTHARTRLLSLLALAMVAVLLVRGGIATYYAFTDSFVAPIILSPNNEAVFQSKLALNRLLAERQDLADKMEEVWATAQVDELAVRRLEELLDTAAGRPVRDVTQDQRIEIEAMVSNKSTYLRELKKDLASGLVHKPDLEQEKSALHQVRAALFQNTRDQLSAREQVTRIEIDLLKHQVGWQTKLVQIQSANEALLRIDDALSQMKDRPIYRAMDKSQNVAFVPYKEIEGVCGEAGVYHCKLWGFFRCEEVGKVSELLRGEAVAQDPWGTSSRGQYALLELSDPTAALAKSLRVRGKAPGRRITMAH